MLFIQSEDGGDDAILVITTEEIFAMNYLKKGMPNRNACFEYNIYTHKSSSHTYIR